MLTLGRGLFTLHWHVLDLTSAQLGRRHNALQDWQKSHAALDTITKVVLDLVAAVEAGNLSSPVCAPPTYPSVLRAALKHVCQKSSWKQEDWLKAAEGRLRSALSRSRRDHQ